MKHTNMALLDMFQKVSSSCKLGSTIDTLQNMGEWPHERNILAINSVSAYCMFDHGPDFVYMEVLYVKF
ncbi:hypothetical protein T02_7448 [Trichinella nativa]|uniref:Uncharacterized protein n=1 Tax=Trichinella nativa TaxID=6335 RepID=A0A0V1LF22_9BILA|nr:hypothetical protein T02_7448 [Trichinella nativa]